jgi:hypothetical protein
MAASGEKREITPERGKGRFGSSQPVSDAAANKDAPAINA